MIIDRKEYNICGVAHNWVIVLELISIRSSLHQKRRDRGCRGLGGPRQLGH